MSRISLLNSVSTKFLTVSVMTPLALGICSALPALAQNSNERDASALEEVVITASRRAQKLMDVPQSVQVFQGEALEFQGITDLDTTLNQIPGANIGFKTTPGTTEYSFRGTGGQGVLGDIATGFYIDNVPYYTPDNPYAPAIRFFDLESVQVLRGPQGTLYGQGSMGGTIIVTTAKPNLDEFEARTRLKLASLKDGESTYGIDGTISVPLVEDKLALRLTGGFHETPGLAEGPEFPGEKDIDPGEMWDVRAKLLYTPNDDISINATYWDSNDEGDFVYAYFDNDPATIISGGLRGGRDNRTKLASLVVDWNTPYGLLQSSTSFNDYSDITLFGVGIPGGVFVIDLDARSESFNQEITLASESGDLEWIVGFTYTDADRETDFSQSLTFNTVPPFVAFSATTNTRTETEQYAVFGEFSRSFMDGLIRPLVGLRVYRDDRSFLESLPNGTPLSDFAEKFDTVSPRFNLQIQPSDNTQIYFNASKGFRSGNFNLQSFVDFASLFGVDSQQANPEATLWAYELGARFQLLGGDLTIEPTFYYNDYSDYQFAGTIGGGAVVSLKLDEVIALGTDLVITYSPSNRLSMGLAANWNDTTPQDVDPTTASQTPGLDSDMQLPYTPEWSINANIAYRWPMRDNLEGFVFASATSVDTKFSTQGAVSPKTNDVTLRAGVEADKWGVTLFATNLLDERRPSAIRGPTTQTRRDPREIGLELTYNF